MRYTTSYILKNLAQSAVLITVSLTSIIWLTQAIRFIDFIVNRGVSFSTFLYLTVLLIPSLLLLIVPVALYASVMFIYAKLSSDSELVVMKSAGLSAWQIARPALIAAIAAMLFGYAISLYFLPASYRQFKDMQNFLRDNYASLLLQEEVFNSPIDGLTVFIRERGKEGGLKGILVHDNRQPDMPVTMMAQSGELVQTPQGPRFLLYNGNRQENRRGSVSLLNFDSYAVDIGFYTNAAGPRTREAQERFLPELLHPETISAQFANELRAELHQRLTWPLYSLGLTLLGLAFLLTGDFNRRGQWKRITLSTALATLSVLAAFGFINALSKNPSMVPLVYGLAGGIMLISLYALLIDPARLPPPVNPDEASA